MEKISARELVLYAWKRLLITYLVSFGCCFIVGWLLLQSGIMTPESLFKASTTRLSYAAAIFDEGVSAGIDQGLLLFVWNGCGALVTMSFLCFAPFFNPVDLDKAPKTLRRILGGTHRMKLLCYLPGCRIIKLECLRRLYIWLMIPMLGIMLLGVESGLVVATGKEVFGSYFISFCALIPHGIIEIPAITLAGAVTLSGHILVKRSVLFVPTDDLFAALREHRSELSFVRIGGGVLAALLIAGLVEAHITSTLVDNLMY